jgi:endoglucanase
VTPKTTSLGILAMTTTLTVFVPGSHAHGRQVDPVHINQVGYCLPDSKWVAVGIPAASFEVRDLATGQPAYSASLMPRTTADPASGEDVYRGDFSALAVPGVYYVHVPGVGDSPAFVLGPAVYDTLYRCLVKGLYYQRCGTDIPQEFGGDWTHGSCHDHGTGIASYDWATTGGVPGGYRNTIGGWHDAGDYGKYSTNNAYAVGILLQAYETFPERYAHDDCGIPESGNGCPDILDEARWSLTWMLTMQDQDGAVRHRESPANYVNHLPGTDPTTRYYTDISSDATAVHCAAMAIAARIYGQFDTGFANDCTNSAISAWGWLQTHPDREPPGGFANLYGHQCATYILGSETGRRLWAAAEVFRLNGDADARDFVDAHWGDGLEFNGVWYPDSWADVANIGAFSYRDAPAATPSVVSGSWWSIENSTLSSAAQWRARVDNDGYGCVASTAGAYGDYYWGFTGVILRYAWTLVQAYRYNANTTYEEAAREQLYYVLGRNPMGKVYITGVGTRPVLHAHGAWNHCAGYTAIEDSLCHPVPYLLVGGPNKADNPQLSPWPAKCYEDIADPDYNYLGNYTLNETSLDIQASLIALAGYFGSPGVMLRGRLQGGQLVLHWTACGAAAAYRVHGAPNEAHFAPNMGNSLVELPAGTASWGSASGIGDPASNWAYLVTAVDAADQELCRSNRVAEHDFDSAPGP